MLFQYWQNIFDGKKSLGDNYAFGKRGKFDEIIANDDFPSI